MANVQGSSSHVCCCITTEIATIKQLNIYVVLQNLIPSGLFQWCSIPTGCHMKFQYYAHDVLQILNGTVSDVGASETRGSRWRTERGAWRHSNRGRWWAAGEQLLSWCGWEQMGGAQRWEQIMASGLSPWSLVHCEEGGEGERGRDRNTGEHVPDTISGNSQN